MIKEYDDGKEKLQSCEAALDISYTFDLGIGVGVYSYDINDVVGYGATKEEAKEDLKNKLIFLRDNINSIIKEALEEIDNEKK